MKITLHQDLFIEKMLQHNPRNISKHGLHLIWDHLETIEKNSPIEQHIYLVNIAVTYNELYINEFIDQYDFWRFSKVSNDSHISVREIAVKEYLESKNSFIGIYDSKVIFKDC